MSVDSREMRKLKRKTRTQEKIKLSGKEGEKEKKRSLEVISEEEESSQAEREEPFEDEESSQAEEASEEEESRKRKVGVDKASRPVKIPDDYLCPISRQIMVDPVSTDDGHTYEREKIEEWLKTSDIAPKTLKKLDNKRLKPNWALKGVISTLLSEHPELYETGEVYLPKAWVGELIAAIKANEIKVVQECLTKDRRLLTLKLEGDYTAFHLAAQFGSVELASTLLENLTKRKQLDQVTKPPVRFKPVHLNTLLEQSLLTSNKARFSLLLKLGAELNQLEKGTQNNLLHRLAIQGSLEPIEWLLEKGLAIESQNVEGNTPLLLAVLHGRVELVRLLLNRGANPRAKNKQNQNAIAVALIQQNKPLLELLVDPEKAALPPLHLALALNDLELFKLLLRQRFIRTSLEAVDEAGQTAFYVLAAKNPKEMKEREEAANLLIAGGANPIVTHGPEKLTPLHLAAEQGDLSMLTLLLKTKAATSMDAEDAHGNTPLHLAAKAGQDELVVKLLEAGASYEARNHEDRTARGLARSQNKVKTAAVITQTVRALKREQSKELQQLRQGFQDQASRLGQQAVKLEQLEGESAQLKERKISAEKALEGQAERLKELERAFSREEKRNAELQHLHQDFQDQASRLGQQAAKLERFERENVQLRERKILAERRLEGEGERLQELERAFSREKERNAELLEQGKKALTFCIEKLNKRDALIKTLAGHNNYVLCLQILPDGNLASGSGGNILGGCEIKIWNPRSSCTCLRTLKEHQESVRCLQILPAGNLASGSDDKSIKIWDLNRGTCLKTLTGHTSLVWCLQILPDGNLASGSHDKSIKIWDLSSGACLKTLEDTGSVYCLQTLPGGNLASGSCDGNIKIWDISSGACLKTLGHGGLVFCLQILPNGNLVSGSSDDSIKIWDISSGACLKTLTGHTNAVRCLQILPDGNLASGSWDGNIKIWDISSGACLKTLTGHTNYIECLQILPDGNLASGSRDENIKIWELTELFPKQELEKQFAGCRMM